MKSFLLSLTTSDIITLAGVAVSVVFGIVTAFIAIFTLKQNSKIIKEANRPYITIYGAYSHITKVNYYLIIKNFGNTGGIITDFSADIDLRILLGSHSQKALFDGIIGTYMAPGQSIKTYINIESVSKEHDCINFNIKYSSEDRKYSEDIPVSFEYTHSVASSRINSERIVDDKYHPLSHELSIIAKILQDIDESKL